MTEQEIAQRLGDVQGVFKQVDTDKSGGLSQTEIDAAANSGSFSPMQAEALQFASNNFASPADTAPKSLPALSIDGDWYAPVWSRDAAEVAKNYLIDDQDDSVITMQDLSSGQTLLVDQDNKFSTDIDSARSSETSRGWANTAFAGISLIAGCVAALKFGPFHLAVLAAGVDFLGKAATAWSCFEHDGTEEITRCRDLLSALY